MPIKDIVNRAVAQLSTCESEPIHIPGSIQPHGVLVALQPADGKMLFCSANTATLLGKPPETLLQQLLGDTLPPLLPALEKAKEEEGAPIIVQLLQRSLEVITHLSGDLMILEITAAMDDQQPTQELYRQMDRFVSFIQQARSLQALCQCIADETRRQTGYDRVMIYRFDKDYNGEVYAESRQPDVEPFLGLHYPHTDIPSQARDLYLRNHLRVIADVNYEPVPLLTMAAVDNSALDLSDAGLRSVSPIHIQYLKNMGVGATLTISLVQEGRLWGLIACHHRQPKQLSYAVRQQALLQAHFLTSQIRVRQVAEEYEVSTLVEAHLQQLLNRISIDEDFAMKFEHLTSLLPLTNATGVIVLHGGSWFEKGLVPPRDKARALVNWLADSVKSVQLVTSELRKWYPGAEAISRYASGIIYQALGKPKEECIIWFREEREHTVNWAGNPHEAVQKNAANGLTPRSSFAIWRERVQCQSAEWRLSEMNGAARFATALQNHFHLFHLRNEEYKQRMLNEKLMSANEELANINWITTHDLKEPLRKIRVFSSQIISQEGEGLSELLRGSINRIQRSAERMQNLVDDILSYSMISHKDVAFVTTDLNEVLEEVKSDLQEEITAGAVLIHAERLPSIQAIPYQVRQVFHNLLGNAFKFRTPETAPRITVTCQRLSGEAIADVVLDRDRLYYAITIRDNGIGFTPQHNKRIFDIFYRLHDRQAYSGTGIGLAICKKIMENHHGAISAEGNPGEGALFRLYFPA